MASGKTSRPYQVQFVDYTVSSKEYQANSYSIEEHSKNVYGLPTDAKVINVVVLDNNSNLIPVGINDYNNILYLRISIYNRATSNLTQTLPIRIFYI